MVSVPSRGAIFLNLENFKPIDKEENFPSPLGELYFLIRPSSALSAKASTFPSPLGELYFLISNQLLRMPVFFPFPSPLGELYFLIPSLGPRLFSGGICRFAWQIVFSGNIAFFGMNFCRFSQCLCGAWETPAKLPDFCFFDSFGFYDSFGCNVISHCPIMYSFP